MAEITMNLATASYEEYQAPFIESSKRYGATILLDGRANVNGDPMLFVGFETDIGFLWNSGINADIHRVFSEKFPLPRIFPSQFVNGFLPQCKIIQLLWYLVVY
jgi:hypothetical protein